MLVGIPNVISPLLLKVLDEMGHGDEIVFADANYPAAAHARFLVRADGVDIPTLLKSILPLVPLDSYAEKPVALMQTVGEDPRPDIWDAYGQIIRDNGYGQNGIEYMDRADFYERGKRAYAIVATGERAVYANILLKKGVVK